MDNDLIIRIGPARDENGNTKSFYLPLTPDISRESISFAETDRQGIAEVVEALPNRTLHCEPALAEAGATLGLAPRNLTDEEAQLAADLALRLKPIEGIPDPRERRVRRKFFKALAKARNSPVWHRMDNGSIVQGEVTGDVSERPIKVGVTAAARMDDVPVLMISIIGTGSDLEGDVDLILMESPEYARLQLHRAYGLSAVPRLVLRNGPVDQGWSSRWLPVINAILEGIADGKTGDGTVAEVTSEGPGYRLRCIFR
ncbi:hypothetical protein DEA8626_03034 [Defluviimonas aquaemixtae]|uniref:Uncharacterized protein n=1 Tax=Albidovulum aquaemixtae TaxID=1542388 RepID=A0A2R8BKN8_9RHOB|nr:hypothetical protein [Defluviimonas aquaemixtae]SPH23957.1 hypothetical protein DEA8626_03034 [Defluviimonas aquaemixtae]